MDQNKKDALSVLCRNYAAWLAVNSGFVVNDQKTFDQWIAQEGPAAIASSLIARISEGEKTDCVDKEAGKDGASLYHNEKG